MLLNPVLRQPCSEKRVEAQEHNKNILATSKLTNLIDIWFDTLQLGTCRS